MDSPDFECWSFAYTCGGGRYSLEIVAATQQEAEARIKALANATCEGAISPVAFATEETPLPSA